MDVTLLMPLLDAIPPVRGCVDHPRPQAVLTVCRPLPRLGSPLWDHARHPCRNARHGTGLTTHRWAVERTSAWRHAFRRLRVRGERRADMREPFLTLASYLIALRHIVFLW